MWKLTRLTLEAVHPFTPVYRTVGQLDPQGRDRYVIFACRTRLCPIISRVSPSEAVLIRLRRLGNLEGPPGGVYVDPVCLMRPLLDGFE